MTADVDRLAASLREVGLLQPIVVRPCATMVGPIARDGHQIVAGHHRVAAARQLGWTEIDAIVIDERTEYIRAELIEIDENLCRSELTAAQRASKIKRRKQIWETLHPNSETSCPTIPLRGPGRPTEFAAETAAVTGQSKKDINRHIARAEALGDDINRVVGTSLDKGVELDALKAMPEPERKELIDRAAAGEQVSARKPEPQHLQNAAEQEAQIQTLKSQIRAALMPYAPMTNKVYALLEVARDLCRNDLDVRFPSAALHEVLDERT